MNKYKKIILFFFVFLKIKAEKKISKSLSHQIDNSIVVNQLEISTTTIETADISSANLNVSGNGTIAALNLSNLATNTPIDTDKVLLISTANNIFATTKNDISAWIGGGGGCCSILPNLTTTNSLTSQGTLNVIGLSTLGNLTIAGTTNINTNGAAVTTIGTGGTGAVNIGNTTGNTSVIGNLGVTGTLTAGTFNPNSITTIGAITSGGLLTANSGATINGAININTNGASTTTIGNQTAATAVNIIGGSSGGVNIGHLLGKTIITGQFIANNGLTILGSGINVTGGSTITGNLGVTGTLTAATFNPNSITTTGAITSGGLLTASNGLTVAASGMTVTGNSTITGTLSGLTGLTVGSGGATLTGTTNINTTGAATTNIGNAVDPNSYVIINSGDYDNGNGAVYINCNGTAQYTAIGSNSTIAVDIGRGSSGRISLGDNSSGRINIAGESSTADLFIGNSSTPSIDIGNGCTGQIYISYGSSGGIYIGEQSTGSINIGDATKATNTVNISAGSTNGINLTGATAFDEYGNPVSGGVNINTTGSGVTNIGNAADPNSYVIINSGDYDNGNGAVYINCNGTAQYTAIGSNSTIAVDIGRGSSGGISLGDNSNSNIYIGTNSSGLTMIGTGGTGAVNIGNITGNTSVMGTLGVSGLLTANNGLTVSSGGATITGTTNINMTGQGITNIGTGGTGAVNIGNTTGNTSVTGTLGVSGLLTANNGLTVSSGGATITGTTNINTTGTAPANIGTGGGLVTIGKAGVTTTVGGNLSVTGDTNILTSGTGTITMGNTTAGNMVYIRSGSAVSGHISIGESGGNIVMGYSSNNIYLNSNAISTIGTNSLYCVGTTGLLTTSSSTIRHKKDIEKLDITDEQFLNLEPVKFKYKDGHFDNGEAFYLGFLAEDIEKIEEINNAVIYDAEGLPVNINYNSIFTAGLQKTIDLVKRVKRLEAKDEDISVDDLKALLKDISKIMIEIKDNKNSDIESINFDKDFSYFKAIIFLMKSFSYLYKKLNERNKDFSERLEYLENVVKKIIFK